jgi:radical SAM protein with 4Fe4S-binding SPASM domain
MDAYKLLSQCDGSKRLQDLVRSLTDSEEHYQESLRQIPGFMTPLVSMGVIAFSDNISQCRLQIDDLSTKIVPYVVGLELTNKCNLHCIYCYQNSSIGLNKFLDSPMELLTFLAKQGVRGIELTGGEPLLHPQIKDILHYVGHQFAVLGLITNGLLLDDEMLEIIEHSSSKSAVQVCLDGPNALVADATTGVTGSFARIIDSVRRIKKHKIPLRIGLVVDSPEKIGVIEETVALAKSLGADKVIVNPALDFGRGRNLRILEPENIELFREIHTRLVKQYPGFYSAETASVSRIEDIPNCGSGWRNLSVDWNGFLKVCSTQPIGMFRIGRALELMDTTVQNKLAVLSSLKAANLNSCGSCDYVFYCMNCHIRPLNMIRSKKIRSENCTWVNANAESLEQLGLEMSS